MKLLYYDSYPINEFCCRYRELMHCLKDNIEGACDFLLENFEEEFLGDGSQRNGTRTPRHKAEILFSDGESSLGDSSLNQVSSKPEC